MDKEKFKSAIVGLLKIALVAVAFYYGAMALGLIRTGHNLKQGAIAPHFTLVRLSDSKVVESTSLKGKPVVLFFFSVYCMSCHRELPKVVKMAKQHPKVRFIAVTGDRRSEVSAYLLEKGLEIEVGLDKTGTSARAFGISVVPYTVLLNSEGKIVDDFVGAPGKRDIIMLTSSL